jgi:hypothetical protein
VSCDAARLEALGLDEVEFDWRGRRLLIPLRVEEWPLDVIREGRRLLAVDSLLNGQSLGYSAPIIDDYRELSDAMAAAVGVARLPEDPPAPDAWFGGVPTLLRLLDHFEADVESDLKRFWGVEYGDRFTGGLTLRKIWTYVRRSEPTSAIARADNGGKHVWTEPDFIAAGIYQGLTGEVYPGRPLKPVELERAIEAMRAKQAHVDKLRERQAHYGGQAAEPAASPQANGAVSALTEAMANRRREMGITE